MLTAADQDIPVRIPALFAPGEERLAVLHGLLSSGFALTDRRLFAWRGAGIAAPLPLRAIERVLIDRGDGEDHLNVFVVPRQAIHAPLALTLRPWQFDAAMAFVDVVGATAKVLPTAT